jgi:hypothetical protein
VIKHTVRLVTFAIVALAVRAALAQGYGPSPGERGDPYSPLGPQAQVQTRYPLPQAQPPPIQQPVDPRPQPAPGRYPLPQPQQPPIREPQSQQASFAPADQQPQPPPTELFQPAQTVAMVGDQHIFYGEVAPIVEQIVAPVAAQITSDADRQELDKVRQSLTRQVVRQIVDTKLMYLEFERQIEKQAGRDKLVEIRKSIATKMQADFETDLTEIRKQIATATPEQVQKMMARDPVLPRMAVVMRDNQCETLNELDVVLRRYGSSLEKQVRLYGENKAGRSTIARHVNTKPEITHQEMLDYYQKNAAEFAVPAKARFELLTVRFDKFPSKNDAWNTLAEMGNAVFFSTPFATVARNHSQEPNAAKGGYYDWTTQGSLASKPIDAAVFALEPGKLSQIIEDDRGYHILRVIERTDAGQISFLDAQANIKKALASQKLDADYKEYVEMLRTSTRVWTIYDEESGLARQPAAPGSAVPR